eukprot:CAMPEP_0201186932 /NCGR_PEP_ID=MMETSP0851-20130426/132453_1 /ASSEMBLY_ACC=CAM_ASM_000631 /TAXON_ID=183588 /ORGANISM="Pseudo-nitzschia fraudulenta, Strain WWA7" /LENGTH=314 /DNA_ID=CAMNT_0047472331 /DNA_START=92 /DNA_END=1036 /DNA_ORIENTATION=-
MSASSSSDSLSSSSTPLQVLEVEQKFSFEDRSDLEDRLRKEGFAPVKEVAMVDWYFDRFVDDGKEDSCLELPLVRRDHWLRYREVTSSNSNGGGGEWQLKRGTSSGGSSGGRGATVYEEIEGVRAVEIARSVLQEQEQRLLSFPPPSPPTATAFDGHPVPVLPLDGCEVVPFARIVTNRAKWKPESSNGGGFSHLVVDLDTTPDGFAIGEVEALVESDDCSIESTGTKEKAVAAEAANDRAVAQARADIRRFLAILLDDDDEIDGGNDNPAAAITRRPPMGKLEGFLFRNRPRIHAVCVESGVIPEPPPAAPTE